MPTFEYECKEHGIFEVFFEPRVDARPCVYCGEESEYHPAFPNAETSAFSQWNAPADPDFKGRTFTDRKKYYQEIERAGRIVHEPGMDKDAKRNEQEYLAKAEQRVFDKLDNHLRDLGSDEIHKRLKVDAAIHEATERGDANAIRRMGGMTSLDEAYRKAQDTQIVVTPDRRPDAGR